MSDILGSKPAVFNVAQMGNPVLRIPAEPVTAEEVGDKSTTFLIDSMIATMREHSGAGLAAPQVHVSKQIVVIEAHSNPRYQNKEDIPLTVLLNPKITKFSEELEEGWEGCLSLKGLWGKVKRSTAVTVQALTLDGRDIEIKAEGFFAIVLQHEIDHLYGKLFVDRMDDISSLSFTDEHNRYSAD